MNDKTSEVNEQGKTTSQEDVVPGATVDGETTRCSGRAVRLTVHLCDWVERLLVQETQRVVV